MDNYKKKYGVKHIGINYLKETTEVTVTLVGGQKKKKIFEGVKSSVEIIIDEVPNVKQWE